MTTENSDRQVREVLKRAAPPLPPEVREQAMAAVAALRPRGHPRLVTVIVVVVLLALIAAAVYAAVRHFLVHGEIVASGFAGSPGSDWPVSSKWLSGELTWDTGPETGMDIDHSPVSDDIVYYAVPEGVEEPWPPISYAIWRAKKDGSGAINLTERAGLGGINCRAPRWSPDGSMILFHHCDPVPGKMHCEAGFHLWVMNADGSGAHRVTAEGAPPTPRGSWSPDGSRLLCTMGEPDEEITVTMDLWGRDIQVVPNVGHGAAWSPDGTMIASILHEEGEVDGKTGLWNRLLLTKADGTDPQVLVEQFISDAEVAARYPTENMLENHPDHDWRTDVQFWAGPLQPAWSPKGDQIAFLAALPYDPDGLHYKFQVEVWVYDLDTRELIRVTHDEVYQHSISWR